MNSLLPPTPVLSKRTPDQIIATSFATVLASPVPSQLPPAGGQACAIWALVDPGEGCTEFAEINGGTFETLRDLYPQIMNGDNCSQLWAGYRYCVKTSRKLKVRGEEDPTPVDRETARQTASQTAIPVSGTQSPVCDKFAVSDPGVGCTKFANAKRT